jgi:hypothetical protein
MSPYDELIGFVQDLNIVDTHEHLIPSEDAWLAGEWRSRLAPGKLDVLKEFLLHYFAWDLVSAGLPLAALETVRRSDLDLLEKWALVEPYWEFSRYTGYARALDVSVRGLYGIDGIRRETIGALNDAFLSSLKPGRYRQILKHHCRIAVALNQPYSLDGSQDLTFDPEFFLPVYNTTELVRPESLGQLLSIEDRTGIRITSFDAYLAACKGMIEWALARGAVALKSDIAYLRPLSFQRVTRSEAEEDFNRFLSSINRDTSFDFRPDLLGVRGQDSLMHAILGNERDMVFQFHTGLQEGAGNHIDWSDPGLLTNLFVQYPDVRFVLFHIGYPFERKLSVLAKNFRNVFIDMCWAHIISAEASIRALVEWLDALPYNKIAGFGGDYVILDAVYGHQAIARENICKALAMKIGQGRFDIEAGKMIAIRLLRDNATEIYHLEKHLA